MEQEYNRQNIFVQEVRSVPHYEVIPVLGKRRVIQHIYQKKKKKLKCVIVNENIPSHIYFY